MSVSPLARLCQHVQHRGFAFLHSLDAAADGRAQFARVADGAFAVHAVGLRHHRVVDIGIEPMRGADVRTVDAPVARVLP